MAAFSVPAVRARGGKARRPRGDVTGYKASDVLSEMPEILTAASFEQWVLRCYRILASDTEDEKAVQRILSCGRVASCTHPGGVYSRHMLEGTVRGVLEFGTEAMLPVLERIGMLDVLRTNEATFDTFISAMSTSDSLDYDRIHRVYVRGIVNGDHSWVLRRLIYRANAEASGDPGPARAMARVLRHLETNEDADALLQAATVHGRQETLQAMVVAIEHGGLGADEIGMLLDAVGARYKMEMITACFVHKAVRACGVLVGAMRIEIGRAWFLKHLLRLRVIKSAEEQRDFLDSVDAELYHGELVNTVAKAAVLRDDTVNIEALRAAYGDAKDGAICDAVRRAAADNTDVDCKTVCTFCDGIRPDAM